MTFRKLVLQVMVLIFIAPVVYGQTREVKIEGTNMMRFSVETIKAKPGEKLTITLKSVSQMDKSQMAHNWVLLKQGTDALNFVTKGLEHPKTEFIDPALKGKVIAKTGMLGGGETDSVTFTVPGQKGEYEYVCTFRAHYQAGMKGKLIVE